MNSIDELLTRGVENIYPSRDALEKTLTSGRKLRIYYGIDPTGKLHLGHAVQLKKLRRFQDLDHEIIILIGDFTARIGDPTDKLAARQKLSPEEVADNARDYQHHIGKIVDIKAANIRFLHNEEWTNKLKPEDILELASNFTVSQLLERDMFQERIKAGKEIYLHEFLYPIFQAYDAVAMDVDMQVGGTDQTFNMLAGRTLMKRQKNKEKFVLTTKLLADSAGKKMGKTEGNIVALDADPNEMFGKIMSWSDEMIAIGLELLTDVPTDEIAQVEKDIQAGLSNPKDAKLRLAQTVVSSFHGAPAAQKAKNNFEKVFSKKQTPDAILEVAYRPNETIIELMVRAKLAVSKSEARRLVLQNGVEQDGKIIVDPHSRTDKPSIIQVGKRKFVKLVKG